MSDGLQRGGDERSHGPLAGLRHFENLVAVSVGFPAFEDVERMVPIVNFRQFIRSSGLKWPDVDREARIVPVGDHLFRFRSRRRIAIVMSVRSIRTIPILQEVQSEKAIRLSLCHSIRTSFPHQRR